MTRGSRHAASSARDQEGDSSNTNNNNNNKDTNVKESSGDKSLANNTPTTLPPITSASGTLSTQTPSTTLSKRQKKVNIDVRRKQNRDAAARHRQRQQSRLDELTFKEAVLRQRVTELKSEINALKTAREGQQTAQYDTFTAALLSTMEAVDVLQANLLQASHDSLQLITDVSYPIIVQ
ncbi:hypothetical protein GGI25_004482 [Coemansia spiralis]|uniref:BZIP domain-containing protein n=1 Tax=Coemansia spiralis TaxID=417178 RepID=A0A9W8G428_9FUNG|nr:hypothetical protein GGI25_004482 [Coemansia spiralis]